MSKNLKELPFEWGEFFQAHPVILMLGSGGVGKTSCSVALAMKAASLGYCVGLLSIDPARRLAKALGLKLDDALHQIVLPATIKGGLWAGMLDQSQVFEGMVHRYATSPQEAKKILAHPIYQAVSTKLSGALEYMALAKLQEMVASKKFDLIVVDTPPDLHAVEFLARPNLLGSFFDSKVMGWLIKPFHLATRLGLGKLFSVGERLMGGVAKVTGFHTLKLLSEFLVLAHKVLEGFNTASQDVFKTLQKPSTLFMLVLSPSANAVRSGIDLNNALKKIGFLMQAVLFNRVLPEAFKTATSSFPSRLPRDPSPRDLQGARDSLPFKKPENLSAGELQGELGAHFQNRFHAEAHLMADALAAMEGDSFEIFKLEEMGTPLHDVQAMLRMSQGLGHVKV